MITFITVSVALGASVELNPGDDVASLTASLGAGDEVVFRDGLYELAGNLQWTGVGTEDAPIVLRAAQGASPVLQLTEGSWVVQLRSSEFVEVRGLTFQSPPDTWQEAGDNGVNIYNSSHITFADCEIRNVWGEALYLDGNNDAITVERVHIHDVGNGHGIQMGCWDASCWTQNSVFRQNWIHDLATEGSRIGIYLLPGSQNVEVVDNVIYRVPFRGIHADSTEFGEPNLIEGNAIWDAVDAGIRVEGSAIVRNNVVFNVDGYGIRSNNNSRDGLLEVVISSNTVANTTDYGIRVQSWWNRPGMVLTNNAVANVTGYGLDYDDDGGALDDPANTTDNYIANNVVTGLVTGVDEVRFPGWVLPGAGERDYVDVPGWDLYPSNSSTLVNAGDAAGEAWVPSTDFNGAPREGNAPDVGAYEWSNVDNPGWVLQEGFKVPGYDEIEDAYDLNEGCCAKNNGNGSEALILPLLALGWFRRRR